MDIFAIDRENQWYTTILQNPDNFFFIRNHVVATFTSAPFGMFRPISHFI